MAATGCARRAASPREERLAILRFENLTPDTSADWMGRAFSEILSESLSHAPGIAILPPGRLHTLNGTFGVRPAAAPGISSERTVALAARATRIGYGDYATVRGQMIAHLTLEDPQTGKMDRVITASAPSGDVLGAALSLARRVSDQARPYTTRNPETIKAWAAALDAQDPGAIARSLEECIASDPDFVPAYRLLAQWKTQRQDRAGGLALLDQALARGNRISELERARTQLEAANLRGDPAAQQSALIALVKLEPREQPAWLALAALSLNRRDYRQSVAAFQKAAELEEDPGIENQLGYAAAYAGDLDTAMRALTRYREQRPNDPNVLDSMGDVQLITGHLREAESYYRDAIKKDPGFQNNIDYFKAAMARLMGGDISGADEFAKQYADARAAAHDPFAEQRRAEWAWLSGRRSEAYRQLAAYAQSQEKGPAHELASRAYAELAIWSLLLGNRTAAAEMAQKSAPLAGPSSIALSFIARFLAQPPASPEEWKARVERTFANPAQSGIRDLTLAYALLAEGQFQSATPVLQKVYASTPPSADEGAPILLAWALVETGHTADAGPLLRANPVIAPTASPMASFYFPRLFQLRAAVAEQRGSQDEARSERDLFTRLSASPRLAR